MLPSLEWLSVLKQLEEGCSTKHSLQKASTICEKDEDSVPQQCLDRRYRVLSCWGKFYTQVPSFRSSPRSQREDLAQASRGISSFLYRKRFALRIRRALSEMFRGNKLWERRYTTLLTGTTLAH